MTDAARIAELYQLRGWQLPDVQLLLDKLTESNGRIAKLEAALREILVCARDWKQYTCAEIAADALK